MHGRRVVVVSGGTALALGATALLGWVSESVLLTAIIPGLATMKPATAVGLALAGLALMIPRGPTSLPLPGVLASVVVTIGLVTVVEYRAGLETGLAGFWLVDSGATPDHPYPLRMSEITAWGFLVTGAGIFASTAERAWRVTCAAGLIVAALSAVALVGYVYGLEALYSVEPFTSLALNTAMAFGALGIGLTWSVPRHGVARLLASPSIGGRTARVLLPAALLLPVGLGWLRLEAIRRAWYPVEFGVALFAVISMGIVGWLVWWYGSWLDRSEANRKSIEDQLFRSQKMEAVGRLASGIAHDFNNVLTAVLNTTEMAREDLPSEHPVQEDLDVIYSSSERASALVRQLLAFCRGQVLEPDLVNIGDLVRNSEAIVRRIAGPDVDLRVLTSEGDHKVLADPSRLEQVLINLVVNACDAMEGGGSLTIETRDVHLDARYTRQSTDASVGHHVALFVTDTGAGIPPEVLDKIFDPFFTTKAVGEGTGLGLSTTYGIVRQSGGHITVYSEPGQGTSFKVYLPVAEAAPVAKRARPVPAGEVKPATVLVVDNDVAVLRVIAEILTREGHTVLKASGPEAALELASAGSTKVDLVVMDAVMPGMTATELLDALWAPTPTAQVICMSGYADLSIRQATLAERGVLLLEKPFGPARLLRTVRQAMLEHDVLRDSSRTTA